MDTRTFDLAITLTEPLLGTAPKDQEVYASYIATKAPPGVDASEEAATTEETEERGWTGFHADDHGLFLYDYQLKGFLKEAGNALKGALGKTALKSKLERSVFVFPRRLFLGKDKPDGVLERPLRAMTAQGPRVTLSRSDYVEAGTEFSAELVLLPLHPKDVTEDVLRSILDYGQFIGLGQWRGGSYGRFTYTLEERRNA